MQVLHWLKKLWLLAWLVMPVLCAAQAPSAREGLQGSQLEADAVLEVYVRDGCPHCAAAKGYLALTPYPAGADFEIHKRLKQYILDKGKSDLKDLKNFGSVYYNSGLVNAAVAVEAIRTGQAKFGKRPLNGEEGRWGLEHLNIDDARLKDMGYLGLMQNLKLSCRDHEGGGSARVQQWDGANWTLISDWIAADRALLRPLIDEKSAAFAKEKGLTPRTCTGDE